MTNAEALHDAAWRAVTWPLKGAQWYVERGRAVPDDALPGRLVMRANGALRNGLSRLTSEDAANVAPWWVHVTVLR